jgi:hypothetical protein
MRTVKRNKSREHALPAFFHVRGWSESDIRAEIAQRVRLYEL